MARIYDPTSGRMRHFGDSHPLHSRECRAAPIDPAVLQASRDGELPKREPSTGCPTCGCPQFGNH